MNFTHASLFSGIGACDLAAEWMGWQNVFHCEISPFCQKVLAYHFPNSIPYSDVTKTDFTIHRGKVNVLSGGFPCQGFSTAGLRAGTEDDRYLWPEYIRTIDECNPDWIIGENVTGILTMEDKSGIYRDVFAKVENRKITRLYPVDEYEAIYTRQAKMLVNSICESLEERGYEVQTFAIPAASVEAPHKRERIWFVAHANRNDARRSRYGQTGQTQRKAKVERYQRQRIWSIIERIGDKEYVTHADQVNWRCESQGRCETTGTRGQFKGSITKSVADGVGNRGNKSLDRKQSELINQDGKEKGINANSCKQGLSATKQGKLQGKVRNEKGRTTEQLYTSRNGNTGSFDNFPTQSPICSRNDGLSDRLDGITFPYWRNESLKSAGNSMVPHIPYEFFKAIEKITILATS